MRSFCFLLFVKKIVFYIIIAFFPEFQEAVNEYNERYDNSGNKVNYKRYKDISKLDLKSYDIEVYNKLNQSENSNEEYDERVVNIELLQTIPKNEIKYFIIGEINKDNKGYGITNNLFIASKTFLDCHPELTIHHLSDLAINLENGAEFEKYVKSLDIKYHYYLLNYDELLEMTKKMVLVAKIFVYTILVIVALILVTNVFNIISTSMMLRSKEFAVLKSIDMTDKEFDRMIALESILYASKALIYGITISLFVIYFVDRDPDFSMVKNIKHLLCNLPYIDILLTIIFVIGIIFITMYYSRSKLNKQNIIETIRNDNI